MNLIGITGSVWDVDDTFVCIANAGKSTTANILANNLNQQGHKSKIVSLASALVDIAVISTGLKHCFFTTQVLKKTALKRLGGKTPRDVLVEIGTDLRVKYGNDVLCQLVQRKYADFDGCLIVDDIRTGIECEWVRSIGLLYHVQRHIELDKHSFLTALGIKDLDATTESKPIIHWDDKLVKLGCDGQGFHIDYCTFQAAA